MKFDTKVQEQVTNLFAAYAKPDSPGFAVGILHHNDMLFREGFGQATLEHFSPITPDTTFDVGSMAKQFVGMAIALLGSVLLRSTVRAGTKVTRMTPAARTAT